MNSCQRSLVKISHLGIILSRRELGDAVRRAAYSSSSSSVVPTHSFDSRSLMAIKERGLIETIFPDKIDEFNKLMADGVQTCYCGFDPTAPSLHLGNLLGLIALIHCQRRGHSPIVLIGSATAMLGDPSGKSVERDILRNEEIVANSKSIERSVARIFANHERHLWKRDIGLPKLQIVNNIKWYEGSNVIQFMHSFGKHLRMGDLLSRKQIETRLKSKEGINYTEFSYQVFQAYDWYHLFKNYGCSIQIGGNDQTGNMKTGFELLTKMVPKRRAFSVTFPLLTTAKGEKLGKSAGNALWLDEALLSPYEFFQFFYNTADQIIDVYLKLFTFCPISEIDDLMKKHQIHPERFLAQKRLASDLTLLVHGDEGLNSAMRCTKAVFLGDREALAQMNAKEIERAFKTAPRTNMIMDPAMTALECAMKAKCFQTLDEAIDKIQVGAFQMNNTVITNPQEVLILGQHIMPSEYTVIRIGKKTFNLVKWLS